jgi:hypothetical protein
MAMVRRAACMHRSPSACAELHRAQALSHSFSSAELLSSPQQSSPPSNAVLARMAYALLMPATAV